MSPRTHLSTRIGVVGAAVVWGLLTTASSCSEPSAPLDRAAAPSTPTPNAPTPSTAASERRARPADEGAARTRGAFYSLVLPDGAVREVPSEPDVLEAVYVLSRSPEVRLSVFHPMPAQRDLDAWTDTSERVLDGLPLRHDGAVIDTREARLGVFASELRWSLVTDGFGLLFECFAQEPQDQAWLHERCDEAIASLRIDRPLR